MNVGDEFRDNIAALLRTKYDDVRTEIQLPAKKADIVFEIQHSPRRRLVVAAECKRWKKALTRDDVKDIINDYQPAFNKHDIDELWIICDVTPAAGAREYVSSYKNYELMTSLECEQNIVDFSPMLRHLANDFQKDPISQYFIPPSFESDANKLDLHEYVSAWMASQEVKPIAIWAGYGMGKTSYARFLASELAAKCLKDYSNRIPILLNLGDFTAAQNLESLIFNQLANFYGVRNLSSIAFRMLNRQHRFILILDGFDEMKFAMAPHDFNYISSELRSLAAVNPKLILLGRPGSIETEEEEKRLTTSRLHLHGVSLRADDAPDFTSLRMVFLSKEQYLLLIRNFLTSAPPENGALPNVDKTMSNVEALNLGDILARPVQAKMLAEVVADPNADISSLSRFVLYDMFIKRVLRREEEKAARRQLGAATRLNFMRLLAWWLWTEKRTRTFAANEVPLDIIQRFEVPGVPIEGLRRELLIGSIIEERNVGGHFLAEKTAGIFYFPHISFTEFLVADYILSSDFLSIDVAKLPQALYGEVPSFLKEQSPDKAIMAVYERMKSAKIALSTQCMSVLLDDFQTRMHIELAKSSSSDPWDICMHFFLLHAQNAQRPARKFVLECLNSSEISAQLAAMFCLVYESGLGSPFGSGVARIIVHLFKEVGLNELLGAVDRGWTSAKSSSVNHLAAVVQSCVSIVPRTASITFDFAEFTKVALKFVGASCAVSDIVETMRTSYSISGNDVLSLLPVEDRSAFGEILRRGGSFVVHPSM